ncbi:MAG: hypothetical protein AUH13_31375 [Acidobacteria bacterium 13_2_20CM_58_27]|nr:MAG: hypothetical protein AUH13_31375 [Acidobacteria bacterium 13_2_20CM_58_27]
MSVGVPRAARNIERCEKEISRCAGQPADSSEAGKKFRRIKRYQETLLLKEPLNRSPIQQKKLRTAEAA